MATYGLAQARYASDATHTVSPARLVTMLYDRLVVDLAGAEDAMRRNDFATVGTRIGRAQEILLELHATLDLEVWPDGEPLSRLYLWMVSELMQARLKSTPERVEQCRMLLEPLRDAWHEAATGRPFGASPEAGGGAAPGSVAGSAAGPATGSAAGPATGSAAGSAAGPAAGNVSPRTGGPVSAASAPKRYVITSVGAA
jgi:flagellar protein FliS